MEEIWATIPEFPHYEISNYGRIFNSIRNQSMRTSFTNHGHVKITLKAPNGSRFTRSVAQLVGEAFVQVPNEMCDQLIMLDGNVENIVASNLAWRPHWFAWKYVRQLKTEQPRHYYNLSVRNKSTGAEYKSVIEAGMTEGLLFEAIWHSTYTHYPVYPYGHVFEITQRV